MTTLEKIRDEIEKVFCMSVVTNELRTPMEVKTEILQIIDKYAEQEPTSPCDLCRFNPPSSADGKPCIMCPAEKS